MSIFDNADEITIDGKDAWKIEMDGVTVWEKVMEIIPTKIHLTLTSTLKQQLSFIYSGCGDIDWGDGSEVTPFSGSTTGSLSTGATVRKSRHFPAPQREVFSTPIRRRVSMLSA